jgi:hypothetical protein
MNTYLGTNLVSLDPFVASPLQRRDFLRLASMSAIGLAATGTLGAQSADVPRVPLGLDAHSLRAMRWKAPQLIDKVHQQAEFEQSIAYLRQHCAADINKN